MKTSEINMDIIKQYLKISDELSDAEKKELDMIKLGALAYVRSYTGYTSEELDQHEDITIAVLIIIEDMYDDRTMLEDKDKLNLILQTTLGMYNKNLL